MIYQRTTHEPKKHTIHRSFIISQSVFFFDATHAVFNVLGRKRNAVIKEHYSSLDSGSDFRSKNISFKTQVLFFKLASKLTNPDNHQLALERCWLWDEQESFPWSLADFFQFVSVLRIDPKPLVVQDISNLFEITKFIKEFFNVP